MFQGLRSAVAKQKKLFILFLITIFLPAVSLSIFGIIALRNEKFRLEKQIENEQIRLAEDIKSGFETRFTEIEEKLRNLAGNASFRQKDYTVIKEILPGIFDNHSLADIIFLKYPDEEIVFPMLHSPATENERSTGTAYTNFLLQKIKDAENAEYIRNDYLNAASLYNDAFLASDNNTIKARMLNSSARNLMKAGKYTGASEIYTMISNDYSGEKTQSDLPLDLFAELQKTECYDMLGDKQSAAGNDMDILEDLNRNKWNLNETQFRNYSSIVIERLSDLLSVNNDLPSDFALRFEKLQKEHLHKSGQWETANNIRSFFATELAGYLQSGSPPTIRLARSISNEDYFIQVIIKSGSNPDDNPALLGIKLNSWYLKATALNEIIKDASLSEGTIISISTLSGDPVKGNLSKDPDAVTTISLFDNNFPPWRLELSSDRKVGANELSIFSNFYFWTIITLIIILAFGSTLIVRIVLREMEVLKIKSDFVSSVSHEFKTPLTSMKALSERLQEGKVTEPAKLNQYISIISHDIDRLIHLVSNILSFSKIEEGKKIYNREKTDIVAWLKDVINNFIKENTESGFSVQVKIEKTLPAVYIDKDAMTEVIYNLLDNAIKFSPSEKVTEVTAERINDSIIIKIRDKGMGIEENEKDKIFEKFYRGENAVSNLIKGTGLGLSLVKYNIEAHGGNIDVVDEPGWSTVFRVTIPVC